MTGLRVPGFVPADIVFFHDPGTAPRPAWWRAASIVGVALAGLGLFVARDDLAPPAALNWSDKHSNASLEIAFNRVVCGAESSRSASFPIAEELERHPELRDVPLREVASGLAGPPSRYCGSFVQPFLNSENSLMLKMASFLHVEPRLSLRGLGWRLQATRIVALLAFSYVLLEGGASLLFTAVVLSLSLGILGYLGSTTYSSIYPFLPVLLALAMALFSFCLQRGLPLRRYGHVVAAGLAGWLTASPST